MSFFLVGGNEGMSLLKMNEWIGATQQAVGPITGDRKQRLARQRPHFSAFYTGAIVSVHDVVLVVVLFVTLLMLMTSSLNHDSPVPNDLLLP